MSFVRPIRPIRATSRTVAVLLALVGAAACGPGAAPDTTLTGGPESTTTALDATFTLGSDTEGATFECALDGAAFAACTSLVTLANLGEGAHTFQARAVAGGQADASPASHAWTIDTKPRTRKWVARNGDVYVADTANCVVRKVSAADGKVRTVAGKQTESCESGADGVAATSTTLDTPIAIALGPNEDLYIAEDGNKVRKVDHATGILTTVLGGGAAEVIADGGAPTSGLISRLYAFTISAAGDLYFSDNRRLRVVRAATGVVTTLVLDEREGCTAPDEGVAAADACFVRAIYSLAHDATLGLLVGVDGRVLRLDAASGKFSVVAGTEDWTSEGDGGPATAAGLKAPVGLLVDATGNVLIADAGSRSVRKVSTTGTISVLAGTLDESGNTGDGGAATLAKLEGPGDISFDAQGNLYVVDTYDNRVRKVDAATGNISAFAGSGTAGYAGDDGPAASAQFNRPAGFWWWWD